MGVGWIDDIYNNTGQSWYMRSVGGGNRGVIAAGGHTFKLDDEKYHEFVAMTHFRATFCGIPWFYQGVQFKAFSAHADGLEGGAAKAVQFYTSEQFGDNWIVYTEEDTGRPAGKVKAPKGVFNDFHCKLRFEDDGIYLDIVNDNGATVDVLNFILDETNKLVQVAAPVLAGLLKVKAGGTKGA